jgi:thioredoxin 1
MELLRPDAFEGERLHRKGTWAVVFLADWCPFCREFRPKFEALLGTGPFEVGYVDLTSESNPLWERFHVDVVPTIVAFRKGEEVFRRDGRLGRGLNDGDVAALVAALHPT